MPARRVRVAENSTPHSRRANTSTRLAATTPTETIDRAAIWVESDAEGSGNEPRSSTRFAHSGFATSASAECVGDEGVGAESAGAGERGCEGWGG
jgi:hypothetical protein